MVKLEELGIEIGEEVEDFDNNNTVRGVTIPQDVIDLADCFDEEEYSGKPVLSDIETREFDDGNKRSRVYFYLVDNEDEQAIRIPINLKEEGDIQHNVHPLSKLFALIYGVLRTAYPKDELMDAHHKLNQMSINKLQEIIDDIDELAIKVVLKEGRNIDDYNSFVIINPENV